MMSFVSFSSLDPLGIGNILCDRYVECKKWRATNKKKKKKKSLSKSPTEESPEKFVSWVMTNARGVHIKKESSLLAGGIKDFIGGLTPLRQKKKKFLLLIFFFSFILYRIFAHIFTALSSWRFSDVFTIFYWCFN